MKASKEQIRKQFGIPDWRDAAAYPEGLSENVSRWEFLRRREDYRKDWLRYLPQTVAIYKHKSLADIPGIYKIAIEHGTVYLLNCVCTPDHFEYRVHMPGSVKRYGLAGLINPALSRVPVTFVSTTQAGTMESGTMYTSPLSMKWTVPAECCAIAFNYTQALKPQIERAAYSLRYIQKHLRIHIKERKRGDKYAPYLRALDAEAAGATYENTWQTIYPLSRSRNPRARGLALIEAAHATQTRITKCTE